MKKTLLAAAALHVFATANAQSSVTLYGLIDTNVQSATTNVAAGSSIRSLTRVAVDPGGFNGSRWGLRVKEDLGGGLAAIANIESGFDSSTGASAQGGLLFGRRAVVGLAGGFGQVTLGRNTSPYDDVSADHAMMEQSIFDPSNTNNGNSPGTAAGLNTPGSAATFLNRNSSWIGYNTRFNNSIRYNTPEFGGFSGAVMVAFGEDKTAASGGTAGVGASASYSANLKYQGGPLTLSGGYQSEGIARTATQKPRLENAILNAAYDFGAARVGLGLNRASYKDVAAPAMVGLAAPAGGSFKAQKEWSLSVAVPLGATTLSAGYAQSKGDTLGKSSGFGLQATYALSKRTTLYLGAQSTRAYDVLVSEINSGALVGYTANASDISRVRTVGAGIRHTF
jgi:predicted porin